MNEAQRTDRPETGELLSTNDDGKSMEKMSTGEEGLGLDEASWEHLSNDATDVIASRDGVQKRDSVSEEDLDNTWATKKTETMEDTRKISEMTLPSCHTITGKTSVLRGTDGNYFETNVHESSERTKIGNGNVKGLEILSERLEDNGPIKRWSLLEEEEMNTGRNAKWSTNSSVEDPFLKNRPEFEKRRDSDTEFKHVAEITTNDVKTQRRNEADESYVRHHGEHPSTVHRATAHDRLYLMLDKYLNELKDICETGGQKQNSAIGIKMANPSKTDVLLEAIPSTTDHKDLSESAPTDCGSLDSNITETKFRSFSKQVHNESDSAYSCYLCGDKLHDFPYDQRLKCEMCPGKVFCHQCIEIYHKHPRRKKHLAGVKDKLPEERRHLVLDGPSSDEAIEKSFRPRKEETGYSRPDLKSESWMKVHNKEDVPNTSAWKCTDCTFLNENLKELCEICGTKRVQNIEAKDYIIQTVEEDEDDKEEIEHEQPETTDRWQCMHCTFENAPHDFICAVCYKTNDNCRKHGLYSQNSDNDDVDANDDIYLSMKRDDIPLTNVAGVQSVSRPGNSTKSKDKNSYVCTKCEKKHDRNQPFCEQCMKTEQMAKGHSDPKQQEKVFGKHLYSTGDQESVLCRKLMGEGLMNDSKRAKVAAQLIIQLKCSQEQAIALSKKHTSFETARKDLEQQQPFYKRWSLKLHP